MGIALKGREYKLGLQIRKRQRRRIQTITVTYMEFADYITQLSEGINDPKRLVSLVSNNNKNESTKNEHRKIKYIKIYTKIYIKIRRRCLKFAEYCLYIDD